MSTTLILGLVGLAAFPAAAILAVALCVMAARTDEETAAASTVDDDLNSMTWDFGAGWRN